MSLMTLTLDATAKPIGLVPVVDAVSRLAQIEYATRSARTRGVDPESLVPFHCQVLYEDETRTFRSAGRFGEARVEVPVPLVMMWPDYVPKQGLDWDEVSVENRKTVSRRVLLLRDGLACQYCEFKAETLAQGLRTLTVDHVKPQHMFERREDANRWSNVAAACRKCNALKGGKLPVECGMMPRTTPKVPHYVQLRFAGRLNAVQKDYVATYFKLHPDKVMF